MKDFAKGIKKISTIALVLYIVFLVWVLFFKLGRVEYTRACASGLSSMTLKERFLFDIIPFDFSNTNQKLVHFIINILNMFIFAPLAIILIFRNNKINIIKQALFCFIVSLIFEVVQFFTFIGGFASDDLLMNTLGYFLGLLVYCCIFRKISDRTNFYILFGFSVLLFIVVIYAFFNIIPIFDQYIDIIIDFAIK